MADEREHDIVLLGATGFTGRLVAEYLAGRVPEGCRWALAGRNRAKLEEVRRGVARVDARHADLPLLEADVTDPASMTALAESTRLLVSTVGPYVHYGEPVVAACAAAGTDYADLTGEPEFVDRMYLDHHDTAVASGARLVHSCGFDSIPHDLGARFAVQQLPEGVPIRMTGVVRAGGRPSGGTFASTLTAFSRAAQMRAAMQQRRKREGRPAGGRRSRAVAGKPHRDTGLGYWLAPLPTIDPFVVVRSGAALERYGPDFRYSHYAGLKTLRYLVGGAVGLAGLAAAAQVPPLRRRLEARLAPGDGPSPEQRAKSWFTVDFLAEAGAQQVHTRVSGGDPGYDETAKMLGEAALSLAFDDDNPTTSGQVTTAVAMGENLTRRLVDAGIRFEVVRDR